MLNQLFSIIGRSFKKIHYHEYPVMDEEGNIIGHEVTTTRETSVEFIPLKSKEISEASQIAPPKAIGKDI